jgi:hypothetical protein
LKGEALSVERLCDKGNDAVRQRVNDTFRVSSARWFRRAEFPAD